MVGQVHPTKMLNYQRAREGNTYFFTVVTYQQAVDSWGMELKKLLVNHFAQKAINEADNIWDQKEMSAHTMEDWLHEN